MTTELVRPETSATPAEAFPAPEVGYAVDVLANNPLRSLLLVLHAEASEPLTPTEQGQRLNRMQGREPAYRYSRTSYAVLRDGCQLLQSAGMLADTTKTGVYNKPANAFILHPEFSPRVLQVAGTLLDYELRFPELSLANALGDSRSGLALGMPTTCLRIYHRLLFSPEDFGSPSTFAATGERKRRSIEHTLLKLSRRGMLDRTADEPLDKRLVTIGRPNHYYLAQTSTPTDAMRAVFRASMALRLQERQVVAVGDIVRAVIDSNPEFDAETVYEGLRKRFPMYLHYARPREQSGPRVHYTISPDKREAVTALTMDIERLADPNSQFSRWAAQRAYDILHSPEDLSALIAKSRQRRSISAKQPARRAVRPTPHQHVGPLALHDARPTKPADGPLCENEDPELFFPIGTNGPALQQVEQAKAICRRCNLIVSCLQGALERGEDHGVFGGTTPEERRALPGRASAV